MSGAVLVRLKGIKQDPRMQRPEAAGNEDWIVIGDVPGSDFSIMFWMQLLFSFHRGARQPDAPFFVDRDRTRPIFTARPQQTFGLCGRRSLARRRPRRAASMACA